MASVQSDNPWRQVFEDVRRVLGNQRDSSGVVGSINWLRKEMVQKQANPNVVRNIIYRNKGKIQDKRALFEILDSLWQQAGQAPLNVPEVDALLSQNSSTEQEILQLLGREKRRTYKTFVAGVSDGAYPKLLVTGRPGSGKTLLTDYIQQALELMEVPEVIRLEFSGDDLASSLAQLAQAFGASREVFEARLARVGAADAFAVQADAQVEVARVILDSVKRLKKTPVLLLHISGIMGQQVSLSTASLRLNTADVARVNASDWLWESLFKPLSQLDIAMLISMTSVPARATQNLAGFDEPIKLSAPSTAEARRFVKAKVPQLSPQEQEKLIQQAGRSFEDLRTLTLLADIRNLSHHAEDGELSLTGSEILTEDLSRTNDTGIGKQNIVQLGHLLTTGDARLTDFLAALAVLSLPDFPDFQHAALRDMRPSEWQQLSPIELAFLDVVPAREGYVRCFSRQLARQLRQECAEHNQVHYQNMHFQASLLYEQEAVAKPRAEASSRYLHHLFEAQRWDKLITWLEKHSIQQTLLQRIWRHALAALGKDERLAQQDFETISLYVASHYVKLGSYDHPDCVAAFEILSRSKQVDYEAWTLLKRAEGEVLKGHFEQAEVLLACWPNTQDAALNAEVELVRANIARWHSELQKAASLVTKGAGQYLPDIPKTSAAGRLVHSKVAFWAGLIEKDQGNLAAALERFQNIEYEEDLVAARLAFQQGDVHMQLGHFDLALIALNNAVHYAEISDTTPHEQSRYLARRGALHRRLGHLESSLADFATALEVLDQSTPEESKLRNELERAKVKDEEALALLALSRFNEAIFNLQENLEIFGRYQETYHIDASYRRLRTSLRLSLAYWCRGLSQPLHMPLYRFEVAPLHPDLLHASALIEQVKSQVEVNTARYGPLHWYSLRVFSLLTSDVKRAIAEAKNALKQSRFNHQKAISHSYLAAAYLQNGQVKDVLQEVDAGLSFWHKTHQDVQAEKGDSSLLAWFASLAIQVYGLENKPEEAARNLAEALNNAQLQPFHEGILRVFGEVASTAKQSEWIKQPEVAEVLLLSPDTLENSSARLPDTLVARWQHVQEAKKG